MKQRLYIEENEYSEKINELLNSNSEMIPDSYRFATLDSDGTLWVWEDFPQLGLSGKGWVSSGPLATDGGKGISVIDITCEARDCHWEIKKAPECEMCSGTGDPCDHCEGDCFEGPNALCEHAKDRAEHKSVECEECGGKGYIEADQENVFQLPSQSYVDMEGARKLVMDSKEWMKEQM